MPMTSCNRNEYDHRCVSTKFIDVSEDGHYFDLYKSYPYFVDVLEWIEGIRPITAIRHNHSDEEFRKHILPNLLKRLNSEGLLRVVGGSFVTVYSDVILKTGKCDAVDECEIAASQLDTLLQRAFDSRHKPKLDIVRTKASPEQIRDWRRKLIHIFEEIEDHDDPDGVSFTVNMLSLQEAIETNH